MRLQLSGSRGVSGKCGSLVAAAFSPVQPHVLCSALVVAGSIPFVAGRIRPVAPSWRPISLAQAEAAASRDSCDNGGPSSAPGARPGYHHGNVLGPHDLFAANVDDERWNAGHTVLLRQRRLLVNVDDLHLRAGGLDLRQRWLGPLTRPAPRRGKGQHLDGWIGRLGCSMRTVATDSGSKPENQRQRKQGHQRYKGFALHHNDGCTWGLSGSSVIG